MRADLNRIGTAFEADGDGVEELRSSGHGSIVANLHVGFFVCRSGARLFLLRSTRSPAA
jgi:hypothetical protein